MSQVLHKSIDADELYEPPRYIRNSLKNKAPQARAVSEIFAEIIEKYDKTKPQNINVMDVSEKFRVQHRRVYDMFNMLTSLNICRMVERGHIQWLGVDRIYKTIANRYKEIEILSLTKSSKEIFSLPQSPSLGSLATHFIALYPYLGVKKLNLNDVALIFHDESINIKTLERRMYFVLALLDILGLVSHHKRDGMYVLAISEDVIIKDAFVSKKNKAEKCYPYMVEATLAVLGPSYFSSLHERRRYEFRKYFHE